MNPTVVLIEIVIMLLVFGFCVFGLLYISPLTFISDYPPEIQAEYYRSQHKEATKKKFTQKDIAGMKKTAAFRAADRNPYSWNMDFLPYTDDSGYEARFTKCGICALMQELGLFDLVPAMCALDYAMSEAGGVSHFVRKCTFAGGDAYCDCGYKKRKEQ